MLNENCSEQFQIIEWAVTFCFQVNLQYFGPFPMRVLLDMTKIFVFWYLMVLCPFGMSIISDRNVCETKTLLEIYSRQKSTFVMRSINIIGFRVMAAKRKFRLLSDYTCILSHVSTTRTLMPFNSVLYLSNYFSFCYRFFLSTSLASGISTSILLTSAGTKNKRFVHIRMQKGSNDIHFC